MNIKIVNSRKYKGSYKIRILNIGYKRINKIQKKIENWIKLHDYSKDQIIDTSYITNRIIRMEYLVHDADIVMHFKLDLGS